MVKLGTLHPDGRLEDLGEVNGGMTPGADSARRAEEYGWDTHYEDTGAFYAGKRVEETGDLKYMVAVEVIDLGDAGGDCRTMFFSKLIEDGKRKFDSIDTVYRALKALPNLKELIEEWMDDSYDPGNLDDVVHFNDWCDEQVSEVDESLMHTCLFVVPVSLPGKSVRDACGDAEHFETHSLPEFNKHGDWRSDVWGLAMYGIRVPINSWESWVEDGEYPVGDIALAKQAALQVNMMFGFFMDKQVNAIGETGWDWMRNAGIIFIGDEVVWDGNDDRWCVTDIHGSSYALEEVHGEREMDVEASEIRALDFRERLLRAQSTSTEEG